MLQVNFIMIYIIFKILVLLKITWILKMLFKDFNRLLFLLTKQFFFFTTYNYGEFNSWRENIIKDATNTFRLEKLKKETIDTTN